MFREEDPCVGVFVSNYYRDAGAGWRDYADYDVEHIYRKTRTRKPSYTKNMEPSSRSGVRAISYNTDFSLTHKSVTSVFMWGSDKKLRLSPHVTLCINLLEETESTSCPSE